METRTGLRTAGLFVLAGAIMACAEMRETPSSPVVVEATPTPAAAPAPTPQAIAAPPEHEGREVSWRAFASGTIKNTTDQVQVYHACAFRSDLSLVRQSTGTARPGEGWDFDLATGCVQLDITQNGCGADFHAIEANWYDEKGKPLYHPTRVNWELCNKPVCTPVWRPLEGVTTYGEWQTCRVTSNTTCARSRTKTVVVQEQNSCTNETREKSRYTTTVTEPCKCTPQCEPK